MRARVPNPILPGFYPDPSICRVGKDYYMVNSTFAYFPGVPIFHSRDLVHWKQIGNVLDRQEQIDLTDATHSGGIYAPTIRHHKGTYYVITTNVSHGGNFIVTAKDPAGPWSNPVFLGSGGIDPSLFFDDDGKCYYTGTKDRRENHKYFGDNEIYVQELDISTLSLVGDSYPIWHGAMQDAIWPEGPHLYKKYGIYYLMIAEGGTGHEHAVTVAVGTSLKEPFTGHRCNPILTHRHLGHDYPIVNVGHGDLVETQNGETYMVVLASRPYGGYYRNLGRETFLVPVTWEDGWPVVNKGIGLLEDTVEVPNLPKFAVDKVPDREDFDRDHLPFHFLYLRNPIPENYSLSARRGYLRMKLATDRMLERGNPSFIGVRQTGMSYRLETKMEFTPKSNEEEAGLILLQSNQYHYRFVCTLMDGVKTMIVIRCFEGKEEVVGQVGCENPNESQNSILIRITANGQVLMFAYSFDGKSYVPVKSGVDASMLSSDIAGGFVGTTLGLYCSSNGIQSDNYADFDFLEYTNM
ncbi:MAG: xylB3 [Herbinix sp.]|nr:xylB3 [Herbinix sp.]